MNTFRTPTFREADAPAWYERFVAQAATSRERLVVMAWKHPEAVLALHLNYIPARTVRVDEATPLRPEEIAFQHKPRTVRRKSVTARAATNANARLHAERFAYGLGSVAFIDKYRDWADCDGVVERRFSRDSYSRT